ncbi:MAG: 5'-nucleotidase C-terminal domain-containing protein [Planctomycetes bacterium]|nr:5'-nucleotidase C-terminal domain-containing protein [Planctomycetota bacterium]
MENAAALAGLAKAERAKRKDVLWLDAGDAVSGTPVSTVFRGTPIFAVTSLMGIDASCLGNHEFDHGWARIASFREAAAHPILCANARDPEGNLLADAEWRVFDVDGVRVGVVGLLTEKTPGMTVRRGNEGVRFEKAKDALLRLLPAVRAESDLVVALTHLGFEEDEALARTVPGVDVVVGGHSHTPLPGPVEFGRTVVVQAGRYGERLGRLEVVVDLDRRRIARWEGRPVVLAEAADPPLDPAVARTVEELERKVEAMVDVVVAAASRDLGKADLRDLVEAACREALGTDLGLMNEGGLRAEIPRGPVTIRQVWNLLPFDNTLVRVRVPGKALPPRLAKGLDPGKVYTVATNSFVADHLERHLPGALEGAEDSGIPLRDAVVDWVRRRGDL